MIYKSHMICLLCSAPHSLSLAPVQPALLFQLCKLIPNLGLCPRLPPPWALSPRTYVLAFVLSLRPSPKCQLLTDYS